MLLTSEREKLFFNPVSTKGREKDINTRKSFIDLDIFSLSVFEWQEKRPPLRESDSDPLLLILLANGEVDEINDHKQKEDQSGYNYRREEGEAVDLAFFLATMEHISESSTDYKQVISSANGQASGSNSLELMSEAIGNMSEKSFKKDLEYVWTLWASYLIQMRHPVNPNIVLAKDIFPKNNGNYPEVLLRGNPLFEMEFGKKMNIEEKKAYFYHFRRAMRLIRDFIQEYIDSAVEYRGLDPSHYSKYKEFIYSFVRLPEVGFNPKEALEMLENQLYKDYDIKRSGQSQILRLNTKLPN